MVLTDFDGTLSSIVDDPAAARPLAGVADALAALARRYALVGVLSGRPVEFLQSVLPSGLVLAGLYGLEISIDGERRDHPDADQWRAVIAAVAASDDVPPGVHVEAKGLSLTLHYRGAAELAAATAAWAAVQAARSGLVAREARMSVELHPPIEEDKGTTLRRLATGADAVCFLGDDRGDLAAFDALDLLAADGVRTLRIAVRSDEAPPELLERADLVVDGPAGALAVLRELLA